jgi:hypothetical protein
MNDPVPAVSEAAATAEIAEIFADIRGVLGVEVVNLIWRHLATIPGALPWAWGILRPLYADGTIAAEARALHVRLTLPQLPPFPPELLAAVDLASGDIATIGSILAAYDRTNAMALIALCSVLRRLDGQALGVVPASNPAPSPEPLPSILLPPLPSLSELPPPVADLVLTLNRLGTRREKPILASMYRHLAYWPAYLGLSWVLIAPLDADGSLDRAIADALVTAQTQAARLTPRLYGPPLDATAGNLMVSAVEPFAGDVIAKMVVICALLRAATTCRQA